MPLSAHNTGITLVALIITIIVLIILAGITLSIALGENGIFKKSKKAVDEYQKSAKAEEEELDAFYDNLESLDPNSLAAHVKVGDYVDYKPKEDGEENSNELTYTSRRGSYEAKDESGDYIIGEGESFANKGEYESKDGYHYYAKGFLYKDAGSIIDENGNLTKGSGESGSGSTATTGDPLSTDQKFTVKENLKWRVLSIENGCVNLVCSSTIDEDSDDTYDLYGITGYNYGVQELNNICSIYGHGKGAKSARSINVDDVNKLTKYNNPKEKWSTYGELKGWGQENENNKHKWKDTYYWYTTNSSSSSSQYYHKVDDPTVLDVLFKDENNSSISYWLASRCVSAGGSGADFEVRFVDSGGVSSNGLFYCDSDGDEYCDRDCNSVRPVVSLRSEVKFDDEGNKEKDGSKDNPYTFKFEESYYGE